MDGIVIASVVLLIVLLFGLSYVNYRRHSRAAEAKSAAALAQLLAEGEQLAALGNNRPEASAPTDTPASAYNAVQDAFERGYRQGFRDGLAVGGSDVADKPAT